MIKLPVIAALTDFDMSPPFCFGYRPPCDLVSKWIARTRGVASIPATYSLVVVLETDWRNRFARDRAHAFLDVLGQSEIASHRPDRPSSGRPEHDLAGQALVRRDGAASAAAALGWLSPRIVFAGRYDLAPADAGTKAVGHCGFFRQSSEHTLWPEVAGFLSSHS